MFNRRLISLMTILVFSVLAACGTVRNRVPGETPEENPYEHIAERRVIGPGEEFATFDEALTYLLENGAPSGGIVFEVRAGTYAERIHISSIPKATQEDPVIFFAPNQDAVLTGTGTDANDDAMVGLFGADFLTFDGINITADGPAENRVELGYYLTCDEGRGSAHNTIRNARIILSDSRESASVFSYGVKGQCPDPAGGAYSPNHHNVIEHIHVDLAANGIGFLGVAPPNEGDHDNVVRFCQIGCSGGIGHHGTETLAISGGIKAEYSSSILFHDNQVCRIWVTAANPIIPLGIVGIKLSRSSGDVFNNQVRQVRYEGSMGSSALGVEIILTDDSTVRVYNNFVSQITRSDYVPSISVDPSLYAVGISVFSVGTDVAPVHISHNSVVLNVPAEVQYPAAALRLSGGSMGKFPAIVRSNILTMENASTYETAKAFAILDGNSDRGYLDSDYNLLFAHGEHAFIGNVGRELNGIDQDCVSLTDWQDQSTQDTHSHFPSQAPTFIDKANGDLHLDCNQTACNSLRGTAVSFVDIDIDGEARDNLQPFQGADEPAPP